MFQIKSYCSCYRFFRQFLVLSLLIKWPLHYLDCLLLLGGTSQFLAQWPHLCFSCFLQIVVLSCREVWVHERYLKLLSRKLVLRILLSFPCAIPQRIWRNGSSGVIGSHQWCMEKKQWRSMNSWGRVGVE